MAAKIACEVRMYSPLLSRPKAFQVRIQGFAVSDQHNHCPKSVPASSHIWYVASLGVSLTRMVGRQGQPKSRNLFSSG